MTNRAERRRRTSVIQARRVKVARNVLGFDESTIQHRRGHYRKHDPFDCGKTQCVVCHWEKVTGDSHRDRRWEVLRDIAEEYGNVFRGLAG